MKRIAIAALSVVLLTGAADTSWNFFGGSTVKGVANWSFFELNSMKRSQDGHVQVWTKTLPEAEMEKVKAGPAAMSQMTGRLKHNYVPIIGRSGKYPKDQLINMIIYEALANEGAVSPIATILFEIDCKADMDRMLSIRLERNGQLTSSTENPGEWQHMAPETNVASLAKATCQ